jgi:signal transduction histidine kinase
VSFDEGPGAQLLAEVARAVAWSADSARTLPRVAALLVPRLADWCIVDVRDGLGPCRRLAIVHADPAREARAAVLLGPWTPDARRAGVSRVVGTGERQVETTADAAALLPRDDPECERLVAELGLTGYVSVPLHAHGRMLGALTLVAAGPHRRHDEQEVTLAETIARVASLAVSDARAGLGPLRDQDDVLAALSHQLRTPLTAMLGWLRLARHGADATEIRRAYDTIERNGLLLGHVVDDLLDAARVLLGVVTLERRPVNLAALVEQALAERAPTAHAHGIRLEARLDPSAAGCVGDHERLGQVVAILLDNALKFTPGGGWIAIGLHGSTLHTRLRITDSGRGITAEHLPHVFDLFRRGAGDPGGEGLGLGLARARALVELHGGILEASSAGPEQGATFTATLPRVPSV